MLSVMVHGKDYILVYMVFNYDNSSHMAAQFLQASAQALQLYRWSVCLSHSLAQALQIVAHKRCSSRLNSESLASNLAVKAQISAQSRHSKAQVALASFMQSVAHFSHVATHIRQASIQLFKLFIKILISR